MILKGPNSDTVESIASLEMIHGNMARIKLPNVVFGHKGTNPTVGLN